MKGPPQVCKAKKDMQEAHGYGRVPGGRMPSPGQKVIVWELMGHEIPATVDAVNPIGIRLNAADGDMFVPWVAIRRITWCRRETEEHGTDNVPQPPNGAGDQPPPEG